MKPDRRQFVIGAIAAVGGSQLLAACGGGEITPTSPAHVPEFYTEEEFDLIARVSDLFIPRTQTPGAIDAGVPAYMDGLMKEWASAETQAKHRELLTALKLGLDEGVSGDFLKVDLDTAEAALRAYDEAAFSSATPVYDYRGFKQLVETVYGATEDGAIEEYDYQPVPGYWDPDVPVEAH